MKYFQPESFSLSIHETAEQDLETLYAIDEEGAAVIDAFLQEAAGSQDILDRFTCHKYRSYGNPLDYEIQRWQALWRHYGLWRARLFHVPGVAATHRIVYAFHPLQRRYYILGIVPREFDYDPSHPLSKRIIAIYQALELP
jgi:hypothetical protein